MEIGQLKNIYFLGIGGIGMSALVRYFHKLGAKVSGYDKTPTALTAKLQQQGIDIHFEDAPDLIPSGLDLVVYTPAIPKDMKELAFVREKGFLLFKRSQILGELTKNCFTIAVAGTHGKTTISSMLAHILARAGVKVSGLIGGIVNEYESNFIGEVEGDVFVVEADEFDRSFLTLAPDIALVSSMDADHLDIYGSENHLQQSFELFAKNLKPGGRLVYKNGLKIHTDGRKEFSYSAVKKSDAFCQQFEIKDGAYSFDLKLLDEVIENVRFKTPGRHNVENAVGAATLAKLYGLSQDKIKSGLESYPGVKRRFETIVRNEEVVYIDDYAHHPEELKACISSVKELYAGKKITGIFQPHLFSRTRDFVDGFARSLELLDEVIVMDIYPARELPIEGINAQFLLDKINHPKKFYKTKEQILSFVTEQNPEILLTLGAGNIDQLVQPLKEILTR